MASISEHCNIQNQSEEKEVLINEIRRLVTIAMEQHASAHDEEKKWILQYCNNTMIPELLHDISKIGLHVLAAIGKLEPINSITISKETGIPKGTVSKILKRLIAKELVIKTPLPDNKKEFLFHTTDLGKELFELHEALHGQIEACVYQVLRKYNADELQFIIRLLKDFGEVKWTKIEPKDMIK